PAELRSGGEYVARPGAAKRRRVQRWGIQQRRVRVQRWRVRVQRWRARRWWVRRWWVRGWLSLGLDRAEPRRADLADLSLSRRCADFGQRAAACAAVRR